jgi:crotonobetainyl-CoA:carnitine CoA-transferase CaiB-like acyl-CoA transferase
MESSKGTEASQRAQGEPSSSSKAVSKGPLTGIRVTELGSFIAAPLMARTLADFGAEVIKVETPKGGDQNREWGKKEGGASYSWYVVARNKKSVTCDLHHPKGQELARRLAAKSDIVVENFRPGRIAAWGLGYETLRSLNPKLVMVHISGFGQTGPYSNRAGFGSIAEAMSGARYLMAEPGRPSVRFGFPLADSVAALYGAFSAMVALRHAERTGQGQEIDVALYEAVLHLLDDAILEYSGTGSIRQPSGATSNRAVPSGTYPCSDGHMVVIGGNSDSVFRRLMAVIGRPELGEKAEYRTNAGRIAGVQEIDGSIAAWTTKRTSAEVVAELNADGVPSGPIYDSADIVQDPQFRARQAIVDVLIPETGRTLAMQGIVPKFSATPGAIRWTGPAMGAHNREIYQGLLGLDEREFEELHREGVI